MDLEYFRDYPDICVVIIGLNSGKYLNSCIKNVMKSNYPQEKIHIVYVDGGSKDNSVIIAHNFRNVTLIELDVNYPTPGSGRNAGYKSCSQPFIQFLDADTYLHPNWLKKAVSYLDSDVAAISGILEERIPDRNVYHLVSNIDWRVTPFTNGWVGSTCEAKVFGGNVLIRREAIEIAGGYDETLIAGEEADLSYRLRKNGWKLIRTNTPMASHDININSIHSYIKRAIRSGYGYTLIAMRYIGQKEKLFSQRLLRIVLSTFTPIGILIGLSSIQLPLLGFCTATMIIFRSFRKIGYFQRIYAISTKDAMSYSLHLSFVVFPQFLGVVRYFYGRITNHPLRNKK